MLLSAHLTCSFGPLFPLSLCPTATSINRSRTALNLNVMKKISNFCIFFVEEEHHDSAISEAKSMLLFLIEEIFTIFRILIALIICQCGHKTVHHFLSYSREKKGTEVPFKYLSSVIQSHTLIGS